MSGIALGFVDFTSSAVNLGFELDNGSANRASFKQQFPTYLKTGTGYAWAGHCNVVPSTSGTSNARLLSIVENFGFAKPTGSRKRHHTSWKSRSTSRRSLREISSRDHFRSDFPVSRSCDCQQFQLSCSLEIPPARTVDNNSSPFFLKLSGSNKLVT